MPRLRITQGDLERIIKALALQESTDPEWGEKGSPHLLTRLTNEAQKSQ